MEQPVILLITVSSLIIIECFMCYLLGRYQYKTPRELGILHMGDDGEELHLFLELENKAIDADDGEIVYFKVVKHRSQ